MIGSGLEALCPSAARGLIHGHAGLILGSTLEHRDDLGPRQLRQSR
jgi:hypothetical protein